MKTRWKIAVAAAAVVCVLGGGSVWYVQDYYHAEKPAEALEDSEKVKVSETDTGYLYDGPGEKTGLIFYPGAKVEDLAYAPLMRRLAEGGTDCFLVHMPCNLAIFGMDRADEVMEEYSYEKWYLVGHSLGGAIAASYAAKNSEKLDGLIFLAAYSTKDLSDTDLAVLFIYGSEDKVLNMDKVKAGRALMPDSYEEFCIEGGNHAQYGDYGAQKGDGTAQISAEEQQEIAVEKIEEFIKDGGNEG